MHYVNTMCTPLSGTGYNFIIGDKPEASLLKLIIETTTQYSDGDRCH